MDGAILLGFCTVQSVFAPAKHVFTVLKTLYSQCKTALLESQNNNIEL